MYTVEFVGDDYTGEMRWQTDFELVPYLVRYRIPRTFTVAVDSDRLPYRIELGVEVVDGRPAVSSFTCRPRPDGDQVDGTGLRKIPVGRLLDDAVAGAVWLYDDATGEARPFASADEARAFMRAPRPERARERWALTDDFLREIADEYRAASNQPVTTIALKYDRPRNTARRWVAEARRRRILEPDPRGQQ